MYSSHSSAAAAAGLNINQADDALEVSDPVATLLQPADAARKGSTALAIMVVECIKQARGSGSVSSVPAAEVRNYTVEGSVLRLQQQQHPADSTITQVS